jgi:hypothetical protein
VWPEDTRDDLLLQARLVEGGADPWRLDPVQTAGAFADLVLEWHDAEVRERDHDAYTVRVRVRRDADGAAVVLTLAQVAWPAWSVISVNDAAAPRYPSLTIAEGIAHIDVDVPRGATAIVTLGYGLQVATRALQGSGRVRLDLGEPPATAGHLLIMYLDPQDRVVSAFATSLPAGDTAAG